MRTDRMASAEILERFAQVVAKNLGTSPSLVTKEAYLDDLGAESLDLLEITLQSEVEFDISIPETDVLEITRDVFGPGILERDGLLTHEGKRFFARRMPELDPIRLEGEVSVADVRKAFMGVSTWVRMIAELMMQTPRRCAPCGVDLVASPPLEMKCPRCAAEHRIPSGDDVNRQWVRDYYEREYLPSTMSTAAGTAGA